MKPVFHFVLQRTKWDCGIACLASLLCQPYEEVLRVAARMCKIETGLFGEEMVRIAKEFDVRLRRRTRKIDLEEHEGILGIQSIVDPGRAHSVILANGLIFDPEEKGAVWDAETFINHFKKNRIYDLLEEE